MPFLATPQGVEVKLIMSQNDVPVVNVWHVKDVAAPTPTSLAEIINDFDSWLTSSYAINIQPSVLFTEWIATDISVAGGAQVTQVPTTANGLRSGSQSPANAAFVVSLRTGLSGRSNRGRTYVPGISTTDIVDAQHVSGTYASAMNASLGSLVSLMLLSGRKLCVLSKYLNKVLRVAGLLIEITQIITDTKVDSQRRRTAN